jgi:predicted TIM-barrel fold metal-dependent hydrolase
MVIAAFSHIIPPEYFAALQALVNTGKMRPLSPLFSSEAQAPGITDLNDRFKLVGNLKDFREVITVTGSFLETMVPPDDAVRLARLANDEVAEIVKKYPDKFAAGIAFLPGNSVDAALVEIDRAVKELGLKGIEIGTDFNGKPLDLPEFLPIYEKMAQYDLPIFIHPSKHQFAPDYPGEVDSKYDLFGLVGWPHTTTMAMLRLVMSGVLEKYPRLKFVTHHTGGTVPYLAGRIEGHDKHELPKSVGEYLRLFYADTAVQGSIPNLMCAYAFFGADRLLLGSDFPFGGIQNLEKTITAVNKMDCSEKDKKKIQEDNVKQLLHLK